MATIQEKKADTSRVLHVTQVRSAIGTKPKHRGTLRALGLRVSARATTCPTAPRSGACWHACRT